MGWLDKQEPEKIGNNSFFHYGKFVDTNTFDPVDGCGFTGIMLAQITKPDFDISFPNSVEEILEYSTEIVRPTKEFRPASEKILLLMNWLSEQPGRWSCRADFPHSTKPILRLIFSMDEASVGVEFQLRFG